MLRRLAGHPASLATCAEAPAEPARHVGVVDKMDCGSAEGYIQALGNHWRVQKSTKLTVQLLIAVVNIKILLF